MVELAAADFAIAVPPSPGSLLGAIYAVYPSTLLMREVMGRLRRAISVVIAEVGGYKYP